MNRCMFAVALISIGALHAGCTQDFGQFESLGLGSNTGGGSTGGSGATTNSNTTTSNGGSSTTGNGGSGGASTSSTASGGASTTGSGGTGGAGGTSSGGTGGNGGSGGSSTSSGGSGGSSTSSSTGSGGSSTSSSTGSGGSGGSSTTSSTTITEDCTNGVDDDNDGDADCADAKCQPIVACVPQVPFKWIGPVVLYDGAPSAVPGGCPTDYPTFSYEGRSGVKDLPAECSTCTCGNPRFNCNLGDITGYWNAGCSGNDSTRSQSTDCQGGLQGNPTAAKIASPTVSYSGQNNGSCAPSPVQTTKPSPEWTTAGFACGGATVTGGGCTSAQLCAPRPAAGFGNVMCIHQDGDQTCPAEFPDKHTYVDDAVDTRGCTPCACGSGENLGCSAVTTIHEQGAQCNNTPKATIPNDGTCNALPSGSRKTTVTKSGTCPASGGAPNGTIIDDPADVVTVCCVQL